MKVAQELLRHADIQTTMNIYTGAMEKDKRDAVGLVAQRMLKKPSTDITDCSQALEKFVN